MVVPTKTAPRVEATFLDMARRGEVDGRRGGEFANLVHTKLRSGSQQIYTRFLSLSRNARIIEHEACYCDFCQRGIRVSPTNGMTCLDGDRAAMFQLVIGFVQSMKEVILRIAAIHYDIRSRFREYPARQSTLGSEKGANCPS
jgi:hypothetical protein